MSLRHPSLLQFERKLKVVFDEVDDYLEDRYGDRYPLHPSRAERGTTSSKGHDGLFNVGASFSAGFGSRFGRGYVLDIALITLSRVPPDVREEIEAETVRVLKERLDIHFPERTLNVERDGSVLKIFGDLSLGQL